jgi:hypothetical protein
MACITLFAQPMAMATTQLARVIHNEDVFTCPWEGSVERSPLRMSWVVVTDKNGNRQLRMRWASAEDCC